MVVSFYTYIGYYENQFTFSLNRPWQMVSVITITNFEEL